MKIKFFAVTALLFVCCAASFAGDWLRIDFNFWGSDAAIVAVGKLPEGVSLGRKIPFHDKKLYGFSTPLLIDLDKAQKFEAKFAIKGKAGKISPSMMPCRRKDGKTTIIECTVFEVNGEASPKVPFQCTGWTSMGTAIEVDDGDTFTLKLDVKSATE